MTINPRSDQSSPTSPDAITVGIVDAVSERSGMDPMDLPPLYGHVDGESLGALLASAPPTQTITVEFTYCGYSVVVDSDGQVTVRDGDGSA